MRRNFLIKGSEFRDSGIPQLILGIMGAISIVFLDIYLIVKCFDSLFWVFALLPAWFLTVCGVCSFTDGFVSANFMYRLDCLEDFIIVKDERDELRKQNRKLKILNQVKVL